jgi:preprotein translocase subunit SecA
MVLYNYLGLSNSHICYNRPKKEAFRGQILYGTNTDFEFSTMRDDLYGL